MTRQRIVAIAGSAAVLLAGVVLVWNAVSTSSARVTASTSGESFFAAGEVALGQTGDPVELLFDADGLYPGIEVDGCIDIQYTGNLAASVRAHASAAGGTGLEDYVDVVFEVTDGGDCEAAAQGTSTTVVFDGRLGGLWERHPDYADGLTIVDPVRPGDHFALRAVAELADDNRAQGRTTEFVITIEARP